MELKNSLQEMERMLKAANGDKNFPAPLLNAFKYMREKIKRCIKNDRHQLTTSPPSYEEVMLMCEKVDENNVDIDRLYTVFQFQRHKQLRDKKVPKTDFFSFL